MSANLYCVLGYFSIICHVSVVQCLTSAAPAMPYEIMVAPEDVNVKRKLPISFDICQSFQTNCERHCYLKDMKQYQNGLRNIPAIDSAATPIYIENCMNVKKL